MKGKHIHEGMLDELEKALRERRAKTERQVPIRLGKKLWYADLVAELDGRRLLIEVEMSSRRIAGDLQKAGALQATWLWIVVPNDRVKRSAQFSRYPKRLSDLHPISGVVVAQRKREIGSHGPCCSSRPRPDRPDQVGSSPNKRTHSDGSEMDESDLFCTASGRIRRADPYAGFRLLVLQHVGPSWSGT